MNIEPPQEVIVEEDEGQHNESQQSLLVNKKESSKVKYQRQYQTNPFGKKLKEVSSISHLNIEDTALMKDLELKEKK